MKDAVRDVLEFHRKFGCHVGTTPAVPSDGVCNLREKLIDEEYDELIYAMYDGNLPGIADALVDSIYVHIGTAIAYGIDLVPVWEAVQRANMAKEGGGTRSDGKILKPPGWAAPDVAAILAAQAPISTTVETF